MRALTSYHVIRTGMHLGQRIDHARDPAAAAAAILWGALIFSFGLAVFTIGAA